MATLTAQYSASTSTLTVSLVNPPATGAPTSLTLSLLGQGIAIPLTDGTGTLPLAVHPAVARANIAAQLSVPSAEQITPPIGTIFVQLGQSGGASLPLQLGAPAATGDPYTVWPTQKAVLRAYHFGLLSPVTALAAQTAAIQDLYTMVSILAHLLSAHVLPSLTASTYTPISLSADEQNALADIQASVQPDLTQTLATIYPSGGARTVAYQGLVDRVQQYEQALAAYEHDVQTIPNLT